MAAPGTAAFYHQYRFWEAYNNPLIPLLVAPSTNAQIFASYLATPFVLPPPVPPPPPLPILPLGPAPTHVSARVQGLVTPPPANPTPAQIAIAAAAAALLVPIPNLAGRGGPNWTGVKHLGTGGGGGVSLWEYTGPAAGRPLIDRIAIKAAINPTPQLRNEGVLMVALGASNSAHIISLLQPPTIATAATAAAQGLNPLYAGLVPRLFLEYCTLGTLEDLMNMRIDRNLRLEELTLWKLFECLVDGMAVFEYGREFDIIAGTARIPLLSHVNVPGDPRALIHFDIKPTNVMAVRDNLTHPNTPLCKIGDFGFAEYMPRLNGSISPNGGWVNDYRLRDRGTPEYYAPEQFSTRWNFSNFNGSAVCGQYSAQTNVWGIGQLMYDLACFNTPAVNPSIIFTPAALRGNPAVGRALGTEIQSVPLISAELKDTIQQCLYEVPADRPTLLVLKRRCMTTIAALVAAGARPEGWQDLERLEPLTPAQEVSPRFDFRPNPVFCRAIKRNGRRCKNKVTARRNNPSPRCKDHWDLREYPRN
ncbi:hypothetical protein VTL71DRAFT_9856 [Oculimacula yallundae]|uniref:Protein kinase domain-containing protein n=1 Tax=Oculimacula yallundae TaxID=86028 RepID=A0ABR4BSL1_9HELO